jgi:hypothetical protein
MENEPKDKSQTEVRWPDAWARRIARTEEGKLKAALEENLAAALRDDPTLAEALEKMTKSTQLRGDWSCCRGV